MRGCGGGGEGGLEVLEGGRAVHAAVAEGERPVGEREVLQGRLVDENLGCEGVGGEEFGVAPGVLRLS